MKKICLIVSSALTLKAFLFNQIAALSRLYDVRVVANTDDRDLLRKAGIDLEMTAAPIARDISPFHDLRALLFLYGLFKRERFDLIHSVTPKAGLLAMTAGSLARVPVRIHTFTGQVWVTRQGIWRALLKNADRWLAAMATAVLADSFSQRNFLIANRVVAAEKSAVLGQGSISGVDTRRFRPDSASRAAVRAELGIPPDDLVLLFLGRLNRDKGLLDLAAAFAALAVDHDQIRLLLVGPDEEGMHERIRAICASRLDRLHFMDYTATPERYMAAADLFCLPSYREGFGTVILEAAAAGLPAVASRIYGITDAVQENVTGLMHSPGQVQEIAAALRRMVDDPALRREMGKAARQRAGLAFPQEMVTAAVVAYYQRLLG